LAHPGVRPVPKIWASKNDTVVTAVFIGFDDSTDHYGLEGSGARVSDLGDAMVGNVMQEFGRQRDASSGHG
jgi:hypothetical protein